MSRMRTHKKKFTIISNDTIQGCSLSLEAIGLLTICLSMPEEWEFHPKQMWKKGYCGRDKLYRVFNELIEAGHVIRIRERQTKPGMQHLPGAASYEIFDDVDACQSRYKELHENNDRGLFIEASSKFKNKPKSSSTDCFEGNPGIQDPHFQDPHFQDIYKETLKKEILYKKTTTMRPSPSKIAASVVVSFPEKISFEHEASTQVQKPLADNSQSAKHSKSSSLSSKPTPSLQTITPSLSTVIFPILEGLPLSNEDKQALSSKHNEAQITQAVAVFKQSRAKIYNPMGWFRQAIKDQFKPADIRSCADKRVAALQAIYEEKHPKIFAVNQNLIPTGCMKVLKEVSLNGKKIRTEVQVAIEKMSPSEHSEYLQAAGY